MASNTACSNFSKGQSPRCHRKAATSTPNSPASPSTRRTVLFICGGAFVGLEDIIAKRLGGSFGFGQMTENSQVAADGLLREVKPEDLEQFGLIPEIIGRLPVIAPLDALDVDDLARILQSTKGSLVQQFTKLVRFHGADLMFTDAAVREIARIALARGTGARGRAGHGGGVVRRRGGREVRDYGEDGHGWGGGEAEHGANEGTAEFACDAKNCEPQECSIARAKSTMRSESRSR